MSLAAFVLALFLGSAWLVALLVLPIWLRLARRWRSLLRTAPLVAALPWLAGLAMALGALLPGDPHTGQAMVCHCLDSAWLHLCPAHPQEAAILALPALAALALLLPARLRAAWALAGQPPGQGGGREPRVIELGRPVAMLHGWFRPTLVVDRALWEGLEPGEREVVLAHESGHLRRRDPLVLWSLQLLLVLAPTALGSRVARAWLEHAESRADAEAARYLEDPLRVAEVLLRCAHLEATPGLALSWTGGALERRVHALLAGPDADPARPDPRPLDLLLLAGLLGLGLATTPWVHHQVEHLLNLSF